MRCSCYGGDIGGDIGRADVVGRAVPAGRACASLPGIAGCRAAP